MVNPTISCLLVFFFLSKLRSAASVTFNVTNSIPINAPDITITTNTAMVLLQLFIVVAATDDDIFSLIWLEIFYIQ